MDAVVAGDAGAISSRKSSKRLGSIVKKEIQEAKRKGSRAQNHKRGKEEMATNADSEVGSRDSDNTGEFLLDSAATPTYVKRYMLPKTSYQGKITFKIVKGQTRARNSAQIRVQWLKGHKYRLQPTACPTEGKTCCA